MRLSLKSMNDTLTDEPAARLAAAGSEIVTDRPGAQ